MLINLATEGKNLIKCEMLGFLVEMDIELNKITTTAFDNKEIKMKKKIKYQRVGISLHLQQILKYIGKLYCKMQK